MRLDPWGKIAKLVILFRDDEKITGCYAYGQKLITVIFSPMVNI